MIDSKYIKSWGLKFTDHKLNIKSSLTLEAAGALQEIIVDYPDHKHKMLVIINDIFTGNLILNEFVDLLLEKKLIKNRCLRLSLFHPEIRKYIFPSETEMDIIMIDNIEFELLYNEQKIFLIENIDRYLEQCKLLILNVASYDSINSAPEIIRSLLNHSLNIGIKKNDNK